jgi:hypothetical protein
MEPAGCAKEKKEGKVTTDQQVWHVGTLGNPTDVNSAETGRDRMQHTPKPPLQCLPSAARPLPTHGCLTRRNTVPAPKTTHYHITHCT